MDDLCVVIKEDGLDVRMEPKRLHAFRLFAVEDLGMDDAVTRIRSGENVLSVFKGV